MASGNYWLEVADRSDVKLADQKQRNDPTAEEEAEAKANFEDRFKRYEDLSEDRTLIDPDTREEIKVDSPLLKAKDAIKPVEWSKVESAEWGNSRSVGPYLLVYEMRRNGLDGHNLCESVPSKSDDS